MKGNQLISSNSKVKVCFEEVWDVGNWESRGDQDAERSMPLESEKGGRFGKW